MSVPKAKFRMATVLALVLSATALAGCVYEEPTYPSYAAAYPGYYPNYYTYPEYSVGVGVYGGGWHHEHDHDHWHH
ncbi:MAG TPA: hypothetical protein VMQ11_13820 [Alphaproteobacteria bacterium]|nr:hypothetical protein [Alphaproteobacteria bacterium]